MPRKKPTTPEGPKSKFTQGFSALCFDKGWKLPDAYIVRVYEEAILNLEKQVAELTGERNGRRIDPVKPIKIKVIK